MPTPPTKPNHYSLTTPHPTQLFHPPSLLNYNFNVNVHKQIQVHPQLHLMITRVTIMEPSSPHSLYNPSSMIPQIIPIIFPKHTTYVDTYSTSKVFRHTMQDQMKSLVRLMHFIRRLKRLSSRRIRPNLGGSECGKLPEDVKEGHFAVIASGGEEERRFVVGMKHLRNPGFLRVLNMAQEEFGSCRYDGLLVVPCGPDELQKILEEGE